MPASEIPKPKSKLCLSLVGQSSQDQETVGRQRAIRRPVAPKAALHEMANLSAVRTTRVATGGCGLGGDVGTCLRHPRYASSWLARADDDHGTRVCTDRRRW